MKNQIKKLFLNPLDRILFKIQNNEDLRKKDWINLYLYIDKKGILEKNGVKFQIRNITKYIGYYAYVFCYEFYANENFIFSISKESSSRKYDILCLDPNCKEKMKSAFLS